MRVHVGSAARDEHYRSLEFRLRDIAFTDAPGDADVVVTDDLGRASESASLGRHVLLESPWRHAPDELTALATDFRRAGALLMPGHPWRFAPAERAVKDALTSGALGSPALLRSHRWASSSPDDVAATFRLADTAIWILGEKPETVHAIARERLRLLHLGFGGGGMAVLDDVTDLPRDSDYGALCVIGSRGAAYADDHHDVHLLLAGGAPSAVRSRHDQLAVRAQLAELIAAIREGRRPLVTVDETCSALAIVESMRAASKKAYAPVGDERARTMPGNSSRVAPRERPLRALVLSAVKHDYIARAVAAHAAFDIVAVADDRGAPEWIHDRNRELATRLGLSYVPDVQRAIDEHRPDVAVVSSEAERHCELAVRAARRGLHVIVDKPLSTRLAECDRLVEAIRESDVRSLVWNRNAHPAILHARDTLASGTIGDLRAVHCDFYFSKDAGPRIDARRPGDAPIEWLARQIEAHADGSDGGVGVEPMGELQNEGIYPLAQIRMLAGLRVRRVFASVATVFHQAHADNGVEDLATVSLELDGGVVASLCIGRIGAASHPDLGEIKLHVVGTNGALVVAEPRPEIAVFYRDQPLTEFKHRRVASENDALLLDDFVRSIETGSETILDVPAGRDICRLVLAALESARSGRAVDLAAPK